jgi:hypothetical protein
MLATTCSLSGRVLQIAHGIRGGGQAGRGVAAQGRPDWQPATRERALHVGKYMPRHHQQHDQRHVPIVRPTPQRALACRLPVALQPPL